MRPFDVTNTASGTPEGAHTKRWLSDWGNVLTMLAVSYGAVFLLWHSTGIGSETLQRVLLHLAFIPLNLCSVILAWRAAARAGSDSPIRRALALLGLGYLAILLGNAVAFYQGIILGGDPSNDWNNLLYLCFYPLALAGLLSLPLAQRVRNEHRKFLLDAGTVLFGAGLAIWYLVVRHTAATQSSAIGTAYALAYPLGDILVMLGITTVLLRRPSDSRHRALALLLAGLSIFLVSDLLNDVVLIDVPWIASAWTDYVFVPSYCLLLVSFQQYAWLRPTSGSPHRKDAAERLQPFGPLPYIAVATGYGLLFRSAIASWPSPSSVLAIGAIGLTLFVIVRQMGAVRENVRLLRETSARENEARFRSLVQHSSDLITILDEESTVRFVSPSATRIIGYTTGELEGTASADLLHPDDARQALASLTYAAGHPGQVAPMEWRIRHKDGRWLHVETVGTNLLTEPTIRGVVLNTRDVSERKVFEERLTFRALHDPLTGLANRDLLLDRVAHALTHARRRRQPAALLFLDLDNFKTVNDSLGHAAGDRLLIDVSQRLLAGVRDSDTVARLGGDEFAILLEDASDDNGASAVAERVLGSLQHEFSVEGKMLFVGASIGIALAGDESAIELLRNADAAMYLAKNRGKGRFELYERSMHATALERLELAADLRHAVERGQLTLHYQPIVDLRTGRVIGVEALVRWMHPTRGMIGPMQFIPIAEETGLIVRLGAWVVRAACRQVREWQRAHPASERLTLTVNVSWHQLQGALVVDDVRNALEESGLDARCLVLEITESVLMQESDVVIERMHQLKQLGVRLAIDDFGTGYSSLGYLQRFPVDILKIDKAFIEDVGRNGTDPALARAIIALSDALSLQTIAEGIELGEQLTGLRELGCGMGQGYFLAKPQTPSAIEALLDQKLEGVQPAQESSNGAHPSGAGRSKVGA